MGRSNAKQNKNGNFNRRNFDSAVVIRFGLMLRQVYVIQIRNQKVNKEKFHHRDEEEKSFFSQFHHNSKLNLRQSQKI
jgi:hypothetical protein